MVPRKCCASKVVVVVTVSKFVRYFRVLMLSMKSIHAATPIKPVQQQSNVRFTLEDDSQSNATYTGLAVSYCRRNVVNR